MLEHWIGSWTAFVFTTIIFFSIISNGLSYIGAPKAFTGDLWTWNNFFVSWIHALICGAWVLTCIVYTPEILLDLVRSYTMSSYLLVCFSTGYFTYDFLDILINKKLMQMWEVALHHVFVLLIFYYNIINCHCIAYSVVALLTEVNSIFLHGRKLMLFAKVDKSSGFFRANAILNIVTIVVCRGIAIGWIWKGLIGAKEGDFTPFNWWLLFFIMIVMAVINFVLFWTILKNDFLKKRHAKKVNGNNNTITCTETQRDHNGLMQKINE